MFEDKLMVNKKILAFAYTILHFLVDLTTIFLVSGTLLGSKVSFLQQCEIIVMYNLIAFAGQLPIGILSDFVNKNRVFVAMGCLLAFMAYPFTLVSPWVGCVLAAIGNGAFHIGAGSDILKFSMPKAGLSGLFVSSGALGVWLAYNLSHQYVIYILPALMLVCSIFMFVLSKKQIIDYVECSSSIKFNRPKIIPLLAVSFFMLTIVIRSLLGMVMTFEWKSVAVLSFVSVIAVVLGKALGGYIGDRFGYAKTAVISLGVSLLLFIFSFDYWVAGIIAILCFNMTMPLTLTAIAGLTNKKYGFAFGMTTFALAIGFIPDVFGAGSYFSVPFLLICVGASLIFMVFGYIFEKKTKAEVKSPDVLC